MGVGQARPACQTVARVGITSGAWLQSYLPGVPLAARQVVISLGVNDDPSMDTPGNLRRLRGAIRAPSVTWLLPGLKPDVRRHVTDVARQFGDRVIDTAGGGGARSSPSVPDRLSHDRCADHGRRIGRCASCCPHRPRLRPCTPGLLGRPTGDAAAGAAPAGCSAANASAKHLCCLATTRRHLCGYPAPGLRISRHPVFAATMREFSASRHLQG